MHNNYFFLKHLSAHLAMVLNGSILTQCFSQEKDELVLGFILDNQSGFYIRAHLKGGFSCLQFPDVYHRAKRNTVDLMPEIVNRYVTRIRQGENERCFLIEFSGGYSLVFKLFGNKSNLFLFEGGNLVHRFKSNISEDAGFNLTRIDRPLDLTKERFTTIDLRGFLPTLGNEPLRWLVSRGFQEADKEGQWKLLQELLALMDKGQFYVVKDGEKIRLLLFQVPGLEVLHHEEDAIKAINAFYAHKYRHESLNLIKGNLINAIQKKLEKTQAYLTELGSKKTMLEGRIPDSQMADILMANLHAIPAGALHVRLHDFFRNREIDIPLKKDLSPQKNAELLYRKSKNRGKELERLASQQIEKQGLMHQLLEDFVSAQETEDMKVLERMYGRYKRGASDTPSEGRDFKTFEYKGFTILLGRNAANNDELLKSGKKDDFWLHARGVAGSHVLIRNKPGTKLPKEVLEKAAALAAWHSKGKTDSLCPVVYTPLKFVRKFKGALPGQVKVEREEVAIVKPEDW